MDKTRVMQELEKLGTEQNRQIYARHGIVDSTFGVSYANLGALKKRIRIQHALALELWATGNHDARILATMIADPAALDGRTIDAWLKDLSDQATADAFAKLVAQTKHARKKAERWVRTKPEYVARAGWTILALVATNDTTLPQEFFQPYLEIITTTIHTRPNRTKEAMNNALIAIGIRDEHLEHDALEAAARVGKVQVDHGPTNCKTPDATEYILKTVQKKGYAIRAQQNTTTETALP